MIWAMTTFQMPSLRPGTPSSTQKHRRRQQPEPAEADGTARARAAGDGARSKAPEVRSPHSASAAMCPVPQSEREPDAFRDWANLPELPLAEVLLGLIPCLRSLYVFAATCHPWRRLLRSSAADLVLPRLPPLLFHSPSFRVVPFSPLVAAQAISHRFPVPADATLLSASRGHLILLRRGSFNSLHLVDALTVAECRALHLPSPHFAYNYAALSPSHLLLFHSKHAFFSLPLPFPEYPSPNAHPDWAKQSLPRAASFVTSVLEFRGRVLGLTDRAQLLEFHLDSTPPNQTVQMLPIAGLPDATTFDRWHFGPHLVAAGDRLVVVLFMLGSKLSSPSQVPRVKKVGVYSLNMVHMRWEEVDNIGAYSLFVDCTGRSSVACVDVGNCGVEENRVYVVVPRCRTWRALPPGWEAPLAGEGDGLFYREPMVRPPWPSLISVYPRLFF